MSEARRRPQKVDLPLEALFEAMKRIGIPSVVGTSEEKVVVGVDVEFEVICDVRKVSMESGRLEKNR